MPYSIFSFLNTTLLIIYLSAIETLICNSEIKFISSGFAQNRIHDSQYTTMNSQCCFQQMPQELLTMLPNKVCAGTMEVNDIYVMVYTK